MRTDELIAYLAKEPPQPAFSAQWVGAVTLVCILTVSTLFLAIAGPRADLIEAFAKPLVVTKTLVPALTCAIALYIAVRLARPDGHRQIQFIWLALPAVMATMLWMFGYMSQPAQIRFADVGVFSLSECIGLITLMSAGPCVTIIMLMTRGATTTPRRTATIAGLAASSGAATGYSLFCVQDNPLFYITWYGAAILISSALTTVIGSRLLRW